MLTLLLTGSAAWAEPARAPSAAATLQGGAGRHFYITPDSGYQGDQALTACDSGYHMASLWELLDVSNLIYDTGRGFTGADSGQGPVSYVSGWIRTGYWEPNGDPDAPGVSNCMAWTSNSADHYGSVVMLNAAWTDAATVISPWEPFPIVWPCNSTRRVWCVED